MIRVDATVRHAPARACVRGGFLRDAAWVLLMSLLIGSADARPYTPQDDGTVLAQVTPGARHSELATRRMASRRLDVALPLAHVYIRQARTTGDIRFLGYAEAVLAPWVGPDTTSADALILHATVLQSRHDFSGALLILDRALALRHDDPQAWLTTATILRVLGRYDDALSACGQVAAKADITVVELCRQGVLGVSGDLQAAYSAVSQLDSATMPEEERAWLASELGEMAVRLGRDGEAERWFRTGLHFNPADFYLRGAYADLLLRNGRPREVLTLLEGRETLEPLLLRVAIAQKRVGDRGLRQSSERLEAAFAAETLRGDGVHRREEARFLLEVKSDMAGALNAACENWKAQHEPDDVLVLIGAARAAGKPEAAADAEEFVKHHGLQDVRIAAAIGARS